MLSSAAFAASDIAGHQCVCVQLLGLVVHMFAHCDVGKPVLVTFIGVPPGVMLAHASMSLILAALLSDFVQQLCDAWCMCVFGALLSHELKPATMLCLASHVRFS